VGAYDVLTKGIWGARIQFRDVAFVDVRRDHSLFGTVARAHSALEAVGTNILAAKVLRFNGRARVHGGGKQRAWGLAFRRLVQRRHAAGIGVAVVEIHAGVAVTLETGNAAAVVASRSIYALAVIVA